MGSSREGTLAEGKALCINVIMIQHGMRKWRPVCKSITEPMRAKCVHIRSKVMAKVRDARWGPQTKVNGYADSACYHPCEGQGDVTGKVCNQVPDSFLEANTSLALDKGSGAVARSSAGMEETLDPMI